MRPFSPYKGVLILELHHNTRVLELFAPIIMLRANSCILSRNLKPDDYNNGEKTLAWA